MNWDHIVANGTIITPRESYKANVYINDGKIVAITSQDLGGIANEITDAKGLYVLPGLIDTHVHSRDQGAPEKEDFFHSTQAAAIGGLTTVFEMPSAIPVIYNVDNLNKQIQNLTPKAHVDFAVWGQCLGELNNKDISAFNEAGVVAFKFYWGYAVNKETYQVVMNYDPEATNVIPPLRDGEVYRIFEEVGKTGKLLAIHAENAELTSTLTRRVQENQILPSYEGLLTARPNLAEETIVQTAISFSKSTKTRLHILHASARETVDLVKRAQHQRYPVTAETCPHYLFLTKKDYDRVGSKLKVFPPVRSKEDQERLWQGIHDNTISLVCSDHAPQTAEQKQGDIWEVPPGLCGVETLAPLMIDAVSKGRLTINKLVALLSENPAKLFGLYPNKGSLQIGTDADITLVDMSKKFTIREAELHSVGKVTAFDGYEVQGIPVGTIVRGKTVMCQGNIVSQPFGRFIRPQ